MQDGVKVWPRFRHLALGAVSGALHLLVVGCAGSKTESPAQAEGTAGSAPAPAMSVGGSSSSTATPTGGTASPGAAGSSSVASAGSSNSAGASGASSPAADPGGASGVDFSHGSRLLIPQKNLDSVNIGTGDWQLTNTDPIDLSTQTALLDSPSFAREFEVSFASTWLLLNHCQQRVVKFAPTSIDVTQDLAGTGAHLKIEQSDGHYRLTHDGPGTHTLHLSGPLHVEALDPAAAMSGCTTNFPSTALDIPVTMTVKIIIQHLGSLKATLGYGCGDVPVMMSGRNFDGVHITLLDDAGQPTSGANVYSTYPVDITVETETAAQIAESGLGLTYDGLIVSGEPQMVRLSTAFGTLATYRLIDTSLIDGMAVKVWSRPTKYIKSPTTLLAVDSTPAVASSKELGATATISSGGVTVCTAPLASDFQTTLLTPKVCDVVYDFTTVDPDPGIPGFLATFVDPAGTCELDLSVPGANGTHGLKTHLSAVLAPTN